MRLSDTYEQHMAWAEALRLERLVEDYRRTLAAATCPEHIGRVTGYVKRESARIAKLTAEYGEPTDEARRRYATRFPAPC